jgi:RNA polymerase sigma-70 factor (ECF subfamily)
MPKPKKPAAVVDHHTVPAADPSDLGPALEATSDSEAAEPPALPDLRAQLVRWVGGRVPPAHVEDLVQDIFTRLIARSGTIRNEAAYARRVARTVVADHHRKTAKEPRASEVVPPNESAADPMSPEADPGVLLAAWLRAAVDRLPLELAHAVRACELEGKTHGEVARALGVPRSTISSRVQRGRAELRAALLRCCHVELDARQRVVGFERRKPTDRDACC